MIRRKETTRHFDYVHYIYIGKFIWASQFPYPIDRRRVDLLQMDRQKHTHIKAGCGSNGAH